MEPNVSDEIAREIEAARILASDLSQLQAGGTGGAEVDEVEAERESGTAAAEGADAPAGSLGVLVVRQQSEAVRELRELRGGTPAGSMGARFSLAEPSEKPFRDGAARAEALDLLITNSVPSNTNGRKSEDIEPLALQVHDEHAEMFRAKERDGVYTELGHLKETEWKMLLRGSLSRAFVKGQKVIRLGHELGGVLQIVRGTMSVQVKMAGRPRALVVSHLGPGNLLGEISFLTGQVHAQPRSEPVASPA